MEQRTEQADIGTVNTVDGGVTSNTVYGGFPSHTCQPTHERSAGLPCVYPGHSGGVFLVSSLPTLQLRHLARMRQMLQGGALFQAARAISGGCVGRAVARGSRQSADMRDMTCVR